MNALYNINKVLFIITLVLYLTVVFGMVSQVILGGFQIITALILFLSWKKLSAKTKKKLSLYWIIIIIYGICWIFWLHKWDSFNEILITIITIMVIPMSIAGYFIYIIDPIKHIK
ncbi:hypothetical protein [Psychroserpens sp. Hel_I_66]|uniref:hypothetical protein n=1 Tax=Psychroserpens sp. Hel_I_66 TaxID=1250004 RepID=UPI00064927FA|nr:hypothetical protein [Psychroserpens sp. Hel_I_66]